MSTRLVILGLLRDRPLHGYEIKRIVEEHMGDWASVAFGSIYFALDKLAGEGLVEKASVEQHGNRPSRSVYRITPGGKDEFLRLLRDTWRNVERTYFSLDIGLFFISALPPEEVRQAVRGRVAGLEGAYKRLLAHKEDKFQDPAIPAVARAIFGHTLAHMEAELSWTKDLLEKLERGEYL
jgi:DNA-binding PadR family transcriptional regulator